MKLILHFYPRPPRGGRRNDVETVPEVEHFYPRPPRGGRRFKDIQVSVIGDISIHVLREEDDSTIYTAPLGKGVFLSTSSARRTTDMIPRWAEDANISIHVLREEDDSKNREKSLCFCPII